MNIKIKRPAVDVTNSGGSTNGYNTERGSQNENLY